MATSQKYSGFYVVPWKKISEWKRVYSLIYDTNSTKMNLQDAMDIIYIWQKRTTLLPSGIEGTLCILEAMLADEEHLSERQYSILCSSSVMRFLNICVANRAQVFSFTKTAKSNSIPDWIINIRHDISHSQKLASKAILKLALNECFNWLKETYWGPELLIMKDYCISATGDDSCLPVALFNLYCNMLTYLIHNQDFTYEEREILESKMKCSLDNLNRFEIMHKLLDLIEANVACISNEDWDQIIPIFIENCLYQSPLIIFDLKNNSRNTYQLFETVIIFLHKHKKIINLITHLMNEINLENNNVSTELSSLWLNEIFKGFNKIKFANDKSKFDSIKGVGVAFKSCEDEIMDAIKGIDCALIKNFDQYTKNYIYSYYLLVNSNKLDNIDDYFKQMDQIKRNQRVLEDLDDCGNLLEQMPEVHFYESLMDEDEIIFDENYSFFGQNCTIDGPKRKKRWTLVQDTDEYTKCAIGLLPF